MRAHASVEELEHLATLLRITATQGAVSFAAVHRSRLQVEQSCQDAKSRELLARVDESLRFSRIAIDDLALLEARLIRMIDALWGYLEVGRAGRGPVVPGTGHGPAPRVTGEIVVGRCGPLRRIDFAGVDPRSIDWGDEAFPGRFMRDAVHHGRSPAAYRTLLRRWPAAWARMSTGELALMTPDLQWGEVRDALLGSDPVTLRIVNHRYEIVDGRHRVMAAICEGLAIPVMVV